MFGFLGSHLSESVFIGVAAVVVLLKFRRYRAVGGAAVGAASSAATIGVAVVVALFGLVALGAGKAFYDLVGEWIVRQTVGRLEDVAA